MPSFAMEGRAPQAPSAVAPWHPWCRLPSVMCFRTVWVWSGSVAAGANRAIIACQRVRHTLMVAGMDARNVHAGRRETTPALDHRRARARSCWSDTDLTPALLSIRRASIWWPGVPGAQPLIRKKDVAQCWWEAGRTEIFA